MSLVTPVEVSDGWYSGNVFSNGWEPDPLIKTLYNENLSTYLIDVHRKKNGTKFFFSLHNRKNRKNPEILF